MDDEYRNQLLERAAKGDQHAAAELRAGLRGNFRAAVPEGAPRTPHAYAAPDASQPQSLEELRGGREYSCKIVDDFVSKFCDESFIPPGAAVVLFALMCTELPSGLALFGGVVRARLTTLYRFWAEAHSWVRANILLRLREELYQRHHRIFCRGFTQKARECDRAASAQLSSTEVDDNGPRSTS